MINLIQLKNKINFSEKNQWTFVPLDFLKKNYNF
jgi:hypothetical protein